MNDEKITLDLVIDVQKDFITGALANTQAQANVAHLAETARAHAQAGHWMFFTKDTHPEEYLDPRYPPGQLPDHAGGPQPADRALH